MHDSPPSRPTPASTPWYRSGWPWALMAGPAFVVIGGVYAAWLAASTSDGLVADDYYKRGLAINRTLARSEYGARIGLTALVRIDASGDVRVTLAHAAAEAMPATLQFTLAHPTRAGQDQSVTLARVADDTYAGRVVPPGAARRLVILETDAWRLSGDVMLEAVSEVHLAAAPAAAD